VSLKCRICSNTDGDVAYAVREMMFGTREELEYFKCGRCGCLQIKGIPKNLNPYCPNNCYFVWAEGIRRDSLW
jgi:hypothetical protein